MSAATLTAEAQLGHDLGVGVRRLTLDCPHATTTGVVFSGDGAPPLVQVARVLLARHHAAEGCRCTRDLRRRYARQPLGPARARL